jgi:hypothetical protein
MRAIPRFDDKGISQECGDKKGIFGFRRGRELPHLPGAFRIRISNSDYDRHYDVRHSGARVSENPESRREGKEQAQANFEIPGSSLRDAPE